MKKGRKDWKEMLEEEEVMTRPFDPRVARRLLHYARPYLVLLALLVFAILLSTVAELFIPQITRYGIDRHIVVGAAPLDLEGMDPPLQVGLRAELGEELLPLSGEEAPRFLLPPEAYRGLHPATRMLLDESGTIGKDEWYVWRGKPGERPDAVSGHPGLFRELPGGWALPMAEMESLSQEERADLRAGDLRGITVLALILMAILVLRFGLDFAIVNGVQIAGQNAMNDLRMETFRHLQKMSLSFFDKNPVGRLVTRGTSDVQVLTDMFSGVVSHLVKDVFLLAGLVFWLLFIDWRLSLVTFLVLPLLVTATFSFRRLARDAYRVVRRKVSKINAYIAENVSGMGIVQVFNRQALNLTRFREINEEHFLSRLRELYIFAVFRPLVEILSAVAIGLVIWYGGGRTVSGAMSLGTLVAFLAYVQMFFRPIQDLSEKYNMLQAAMASSERIFQVLDEPEDIPNPAEPVSIPQPEGRIEFEKVWFAYQGEDWVLKDVSFTLEPGRSLALVGPTGAGKSSIINLLGRYYDVSKGRILWDGVDIRKLDKHWLRNMLGVVMQDVFLFTGDIRSNIRLRSRHITDDAVVQAAEQVMASGFINRLPERYMEDVKERGASLSVGQKQLLAFARALVFDPKVLILDEATANVDSETESLIQESLEQLMMERTSIVIAHRLSTVRNADRIIVLQDGRIVESGSHEELLSTGGLYRLLYETQALS